MKRSNFKIYFLELTLIVFLFFALFASNIINRIIVTLVLLISMMLIIKFIKSRGIRSIYKKQVSFLMLIFGVIYLALYYALGLYYGFVKTKYILSFDTLRNLVIPLTLIIISSEMIRNRLLVQNVKLDFRGHKVNISKFLIFIIMILIDFIIYTDVYGFDSLDNFIAMIGCILFVSISSNLLYNYMSPDFGYMPIIIYRLVTIMLLYIIPIKPDVYEFVRIFMQILFPYLIYVILENSYSRTTYAIAYVEKGKNILFNTILLVFTALVIMLISCQFKYGILVVGSRSMTGSINIGDAVFYTDYDKYNKELKAGDVIVFDKDGTRTVHRILNIKTVNGEYQIYTKGDANKKPDYGFITDQSVYGVVNFKIKYIGYPTIWVRKLFEK